MAWFKSIEDIHNRLLQKDAALSLQVDVTATPKHNNGAIFVQTVADYPLVEAISQNVVKHPVLPDAASRAKLHERQSAKYTEKYADYMHLGVIEWRKAYDRTRKAGQEGHPVRDDRRHAATATTWPNIWKATIPTSRDAVLVIHTKKQRRDFRINIGKSKEELDELRKQANEIDGMDSPLQGDRLRDGAQGRLGRAQRDDDCRPARLLPQRATSCRSRRLGAVCARCIPAAWRNT